MTWPGVLIGLLTLGVLGCATGMPSPVALPIPLPDLTEDMPPAERLRVIREFKIHDAEAAARRAAGRGDLRGATCWNMVAQVTRERQAQIPEPLAGPIDAFEAIRLELHPPEAPDDRVAVACDALVVQTGKYVLDDARKAAALASSMGVSGNYLEYAQKGMAIIKALIIRGR